MRPNSDIFPDNKYDNSLPTGFWSCAPKVEVGAVVIVNKVYPSVFANDTANALDSTDYATGANKVKFLFAVIFPSTRTALCPCQVI